MTGNRAKTHRLCNDKDATKRMLLLSGLPTPRSTLFRTKTQRVSFPLPAIVKPCREDGSVGISEESVVYDEDALRKRAIYILEELEQPALIEQFIDGRELNLSLLQTSQGVRLLPPAEIDFTGLPENLPRIVAYDAKWSPGTAYDKYTARRFPKLLPNFEARLYRLVSRAFSALGLRGYARIDLRLDKRGLPFIIDVNPNCDLAPDAGMAAAAYQGGLSYKELLEKIVQNAQDPQN